MKKNFIGIITVAALFIGCSTVEDTIEESIENVLTANLQNANNLTRDIAISDSDEYHQEIIDTAGEHEFSGDLVQTQIVIDVDDDEEVQLILNNVSISNSVNAPIYIKNAKEVEIVLAEGSSNVLTDGIEYILADEENINAVIYSKDDLKISGGGSLKINANYNDGINSNDNLEIVSGTYYVNSQYDAFVGKDNLTVLDGEFNIITNEGSENAPVKVEEEMPAGHMPGRGMAPTTPAQDETVVEVEDNTPSAKGLKTEGTMTIENGTFNINSYDDSFHSDDTIIINNGSFELRSGDDTFHADKYLTINDGEINILYSYEGLEANIIEINGGKIDIYAYDDGINAVADETLNTLPNIIINDGVITIDAAYDMIDSNGNIEINGGEIYGLGHNSDRDTMFDFDYNLGEVNGGEIIAVGVIGRNLSQLSDSSSQNSVLYVFDNVIAKNSPLTVYSESGEEILTVTPNKNYQAVIVSSDKLIQGETIVFETTGIREEITLNNNSTVTTNYVMNEGFRGP